MDEKSPGLSQGRYDPRQGHALVRLHRWAIGSCWVCLLACTLGPDRVGVGVSRSFLDGSHLVGNSGEESRSDLRNSGNDDVDTLWIYGEWDLKPQKVEFVGPPRAWGYLDDWKLPQDPEKKVQDPPPPVVILDHGAHQDPTDEADLLKKGLDAVADTSWSTIEKIGYLVMSLAVLGLVFFGIKVTMKKKE